MGMKEYIVQAIEQETIDEFDAHNVPELIRCKDCIKVDVCCRRVTDNPDWFCADGERKEV